MRVDEWYPSAVRRMEVAALETRHGEHDAAWRRDAAFDLHQATERLHHCLLLVLTQYSPKSHKLNFLRSQAEQLDARLTEVWPRSTKFEQRCFELLRRAYVEARYSPHYTITAEELAWLGERITHLQAAVKQACEERIAALTVAAG